MARRLAYTVHVPVYAESGDGVKYLDRVEMFVRGEELPEWAAPLVGDHVYEPGEAPTSASPAPVEPVEAPAPAPEPEPVSEPEQPAGNASADVWRAYAVAARGANPEDVAGMNRNELRDTFGQ